MNSTHKTTAHGLTIEVINQPTTTPTWIITGGFPKPQSWSEYLGKFSKKEQKILQTIRKAIEEMGWVGTKANQKADITAFRINNDLIQFTHKAWGDLMAAIVNKQEHYTIYTR